MAASGCTGATRRVDQVVSVTPETMCTHPVTGDAEADASAKTDCFPTDVVSDKDTIVVGDCVELRRSGSTDEVLSARFADCPD